MDQVRVTVVSRRVIHRFVPVLHMACGSVQRDPVLIGLFRPSLNVSRPPIGGVKAKRRKGRDGIGLNAVRAAAL